MSQTPGIDVKNTTHSRTPQINWGVLAQRALGANYELSVVVCGDLLAKKLNKKYRDKDYCPNVLSFPISNSSGEIFLNIRQSSREAHKYNRSVSEHNLALYIHGLAHLAGHDHGKKMENLEQKLLGLKK